MKKRFSGPQIVAKLRQADVLIGQSKTVPEVCKEIEISQHTYYRWRQKYGGMSPDMIKQLRALQKENVRLKRVIADQALDNAILKAAAMNNYQRDGYMRLDANGGGGPNYYPNSMGGPEPESGTGEPPFGVSGMAGRHEYSHPNDDFVQAGALYRKVMADEARDHLIDNIVSHLCGAQKRIQLRQTAIFYKADLKYGRRVAEGLGLSTKEVEKLAGMSQADRVKATLQ